MRGYYKFIFLIFILSILQGSSKSSGHIVVNSEDLVLDFSPEQVTTTLSSKIVRLNQSKQSVNISKIDDSFIFDPILIDFQIYNETRNRFNQSHFAASGVDIELVTIYEIRINETHYETISNSKKVPQYFGDKVDFTSVVDPSVDLGIFKMYDNQSTIKSLKDDSVNYVDVTFQLVINRFGISLTDFDVRIDYVVRSQETSVVGMELFHHEITGFIDMVPVSMRINRYDLSYFRKFYVQVPLGLTSRFYEQILRSHNLSSRGNLELVVGLVILDLENSIDENDVDLRIFHEGRKMRRTRYSNVSVEYKLDIEVDSIDQQVLDLDVQNLGNGVQIFLQYAVLKLPALFKEKEESQWGMIWGWARDNLWVFGIVLSISVLSSALTMDVKNATKEFYGVPVDRTTVRETHLKPFGEKYWRSERMKGLDKENPSGGSMVLEESEVKPQNGINEGILHDKNRVVNDENHQVKPSVRKWMEGEINDVSRSVVDDDHSKTPAEILEQKRIEADELRSDPRYFNVDRVDGEQRYRSESSDEVRKAVSKNDREFDRVEINPNFDVGPELADRRDLDRLRGQEERPRFEELEIHRWAENEDRMGRADHELAEQAREFRREAEVQRIREDFELQRQHHEIREFEGARKNRNSDLEEDGFRQIEHAELEIEPWKVRYGSDLDRVVDRTRVTTARNLGGSQRRKEEDVFLDPKGSEVEVVPDPIERAWALLMAGYSVGVAAAVTGVDRAYLGGLLENRSRLNALVNSVEERRKFNQKQLKNARQAMVARLKKMVREGLKEGVKQDQDPTESIDFNETLDVETAPLSNLVTKLGSEEVSENSENVEDRVSKDKNIISGYSKAASNEPDLTLDDLVDLKVSLDDLREFVDQRIGDKLDSGQDPRYEVILGELLREPETFVERLRIFGDLDIFYVLVRLDYYKDLDIVKQFYDENELIVLKEVFGIVYAKDQDFQNFRYHSYQSWAEESDVKLHQNIKDALKNLIDTKSGKVLEGKEGELKQYTMSLKRNFIVKYLESLGEALYNSIDEVIDSDLIFEFFETGDSGVGLFSKILSIFDIWGHDMTEFVNQLSEHKYLPRLAEIEHALEAIKSHRNLVSMFMKLKGGSKLEIDEFLENFEKKALILQKKPNGFDFLIYYRLPIKSNDKWAPGKDYIMVPGEVKSSFDGVNMTSRFLSNVKHKHGKDYIDGPLDRWSKHKSTPEDIEKIVGKNQLNYDDTINLLQYFDEKIKSCYNSIALFGAKTQNILERTVETEEYSTLRIIFKDSQDIIRIQIIKPSELHLIINSPDNTPISSISPFIKKLKIPLREEHGQLIPGRFIERVGEFKKLFETEYRIFPDSVFEIKIVDGHTIWESKVAQHIDQYPMSKTSLRIPRKNIPTLKLSKFDQVIDDIVLTEPVSFNFSDDNKTLHKLSVRIWDLNKISNTNSNFKMAFGSKKDLEITEASKLIEQYLRNAKDENCLIIPSINKNNQSADLIAHRLENLNLNKTKKSSIWYLNYYNENGKDQVEIKIGILATRVLASKKLIAMLSNYSNDTTNYYYGITRFGRDPVTDDAIIKRLKISDSPFKPLIIRNTFFDVTPQKVDEFLDVSDSANHNRLYHTISRQGIFIDLKAIRKRITKQRDEGTIQYIDDEGIDRLVSFFDLESNQTGSDAQERWIKYLINYFTPNRHDSIKHVEGKGDFIRHRAWTNIPPEFNPFDHLRKWLTYNPGRGPESKNPVVRSLVHKQKGKDRPKWNILKSHKGLEQFVDPILIDELNVLKHKNISNHMRNDGSNTKIQFREINLKIFNNIVDKVEIILKDIIEDIFQSTQFNQTDRRI